MEKLRQLLHDFAWSLHIGKLHELFLHDGITFATWGLVVVTILLVAYSWHAGREQRKRWEREDEQRKQDRDEERARWKREDEIRNESQNPVFTFGLDWGASKSGIVLWCANLGLVTFQVEKVSAIVISDHNESSSSIADFVPQTLVKSGEKVDIPLPLEVFSSVFFSADLEFSISIAYANRRLLSEAKAYSFFAANKGRIDRMSEGFHSLQKVKCEKCEANGFADPKGVLSRSELQAIRSRAESDLSTSCPNHYSEFLRSVVDINGVTTRFTNNG
jgi:cbb3-type cytochrome oxidase subunit 3